MDDVLEIQLATGPHGGPDNPHVVASPTSLRCLECGENLAAALLARMVAASERAKEVSGG